LVPRFDLRLGQVQRFGHVTAVCHGQVLLRAKLSFQVRQLRVRERRPPTSHFSAARGLAAGQSGGVLMMVLRVLLIVLVVQVVIMFLHQHR